MEAGIATMDRHLRKGYAAGYGELRGYSGSTEMRVYTGSNGRNGWLRNPTVQTDGIGPITMAGTFRNGSLISGTEITQRDGYTSRFLKQVRSYSTASSNDSSGSGLSTFAALGMAQGVANEQGAAVPATQPMPKPIHPPCAFGDAKPVHHFHRHPHNASPGTHAIGRRDTPSGDEAVRNQCATIERYQGTWKAMNRCQEVVFVAFCHVNPDPDSWGRSLNCGNDQYGLAGPIHLVTMKPSARRKPLPT